jgi:hypothetical protein
LEHDGDFGWQKLTVGCADILEKEVCVFQETPIHELRSKKWLKFIPISDMKIPAQNRLRRISKQQDGLWQLHLHHDKWRIWGYYEEPNFAFLWWDPDHGVATGASRRRSQ